MFSVASAARLAHLAFVFEEVFGGSHDGLDVSFSDQLTSKWFTQPKWFGVKIKMKISINPHILLKNTQLTLVHFNNDQSNFLTFTPNQVVCLLKL